MDSVGEVERGRACEGGTMGGFRGLNGARRASLCEPALCDCVSGAEGTDEDGESERD